MKRFQWLLMCLLGSLLITVAVKPANADAWNKKTYVTISQSIEVPGAILPPGKYVFKLLDSQSNRHIVQIMNDRENHVYATNLAIPTERMEPASRTIITFYEMPGGGPEPIRSWYYPGDTIGQEFAYPPDRARLISEAIHGKVPMVAESQQPAQPVTQPATPPPAVSTAPPPEPANPPETAAAEPPPPPPSAEEPSQPEEQAAPAPAPAPQSTPEPTMPKTASDIYAVGLAGLTCLVIAVAFRVASRQSRNER